MNLSNSRAFALSTESGPYQCSKPADLQALVSAAVALAAPMLPAADHLERVQQRVPLQEEEQRPALLLLLKLCQQALAHFPCPLVSAQLDLPPVAAVALTL